MSELPFLTLLTLRQSGNIHRTASNIQSLIPRFRAVGVLIPPPENNPDGTAYYYNRNEFYAAHSP
jgi:hypothetical protein